MTILNPLLKQGSSLAYGSGAGHTLQVPAVNTEGWALTAEAGSINRYEGLVLSAVKTAGDGYQVLDPGSFGFPNPPDICKTIEQVTGKPCSWEVKMRIGVDGSKVIEVNLRAGENILAQGQAIEWSEQGYKGWVTYLRVAEWLRGEGLGALIWRSLDLGIRGWTVLSGAGDKANIFFADAAGWGQAIYSKIPPDLIVKFVDTTSFIYQVAPPGSLPGD
jgi:hypothetical protein